MSNIIPETLLEDLYQSKMMSVRQISENLNISEHSIRKAMIKYDMPRRTIQEAAYAKHAKTFAIRSPLNSEEQVLYGIGLGLYWGEGNKVDPNSVRPGNTDPNLIKTFVKFLQDICGISDADIKFGLQVFNDSDPLLALEFWKNTLSVDTGSFHATVSIIAPQGKGNYRNKNTYGVLQVYVCNKRFKEWIMSVINEMPK